jgi:H+-translocating NAD(P) transhydrogenase subunit beta
MSWFVNASYFVAAVLFILGLKGMSSPLSAQKGIIWAGVGMVLATLVTFVHPEIHGAANYILMIIAIAIGGGIAWVSGKRVAMTDMPQMIAIYNGMGGGAAAAIAAVELVRIGGTPIGEHHSSITITLAVVGALIGAVSFSGSAIAFAKLQGWMNKTYQLPMHQIVSIGSLVAAVILGIVIILNPHTSGFVLFLFFAIALIYGVLMTVPIGGADMPVVISLFNALTGLAVAFEGFVLQNAAMIIAGTVVGAAGTLLTQLMAKAMNRRISKLLAPSPVVESTGEVQGTQKAIEAQDAAIQMAYAAKVVIVPGYGMAVAQAQHKVWEMSQLLEQKGIEVKFAIHPVAGRMPGHMNVLLAEAGVPYDKIFDLDEINAEFPNTDVALIITDPGSPIYGMPILNVDYAKSVIVIKRGKGAGFSGIENALFYMDNTRMYYGGAQEAVNHLIQQLKQL